jgi:hypothetical protein
LGIIVPKEFADMDIKRRTMIKAGLGAALLLRSHDAFGQSQPLIQKKSHRRARAFQSSVSAQRAVTKRSKPMPKKYHSARRSGSFRL